METLKDKQLHITIGTMVTLLIFIVGGTISIANMKADVDSQLSTMDNRYEHVLKFYNILSEKQELLNVEDQRQDLVIMEISTKLKNIETMLMDIKKKLE